MKLMGKVLISDCGYFIHADYRVSDIDKRSMFDRLFTLPFKPCKKYKKSRKVYVLCPKVILVSYDTFRMLMKRCDK